MLHGYGIYEKETKNITSNRTLYLAFETIEAIKKWKIEQAKQKLKMGNKWENSDRLFTNEVGKDIHPNAPSKILARIIRQYELPHITFHGLRHTSITLLISKNVQTQIISKRAGHSNITTTHQIYSHFLNDEFKNVADTMQGILTASVVGNSN